MLFFAHRSRAINVKRPPPRPLRTFAPFYAFVESKKTVELEIRLDIVSQLLTLMAVLNLPDIGLKRV